MTQGLEVYKPALLPATAAEAETQANAIINQYSGWATALMRVVEDKHLFEIISGKKYLKFEAWQLIGTFDHAYVNTDDVAPVIEGGEVTGYMCRAKVMRDGVVVGGASQMCGLDAFPCRGKEGSAKHNAAISAAQTWAGSKSFKMRYSSVATLGGYEAATAEEMNRATEEAPDKSAHYCAKHQTNWFKKGKMRGFAHKVEETGEWCNEPSQEAPGGGRVVDQAPATAPSPQAPPRAAERAQQGFCEGHQAPMYKGRTGKVGHLQDGQPCFGIPAQARQQGDGEFDGDTPIHNVDYPAIIASLETWNTDIQNEARQGKMLTLEFVQDWVEAALGLEWAGLTDAQVAAVAKAIADGAVK